MFTYERFKAFDVWNFYNFSVKKLASSKNGRINFSCYHFIFSGYNCI